MQERHETTLLNTNKHFFSDNYIVDIFVFISAIISLLTTILTIYLLCKHKKIRVLIAGLVLHQVKEIGTISGSARETNPECTTLAYIGITLIILSDEIKVRHLMNREPWLFHLMLKHGIMWFTFATETQETV